MASLKKIWFFVALAVSAWAQDATSNEYRYLVPLPGTKNIAIADWDYFLEFMSLNEQPYVVAMEQYDIRGRLLDRTDYGVRMGPEIFRWNITENAVNSRLRSVVIVSNQQLIGSLIMWNEQFGQVNSMRLAQNMSETLVMPFIPQSFFEMTSSFALQGFSAGGQSSEISFFLVDADERLQDPLSLRSNLTSFGYIIGTPELTLSLGGLDGEVVPSWANIQPLAPEFLMSGFQTFTRENSKAFLFQSAGSELEERGYSTGHVLFSKEYDNPSLHEIILTNPSTNNVVVDLEMFYRDFEPLIDRDMLKSLAETIALGPLERRRLLLGQDIFAELSQPYFRLTYESRTSGETPEPAEIFALHFQMGASGEMGGASFAQAGTEIRSWLTASDLMTTTIELINTDRHSLAYPDVEVIDGEEVPVGDPVLVSKPTRFTLKIVAEDGTNVQTIFDHDSLERYTVLPLEKINSLAFGGNPQDAVQIIFTVDSGSSIIGKVTRRGGNDIGISNPYTTTPVVADPE